MSNNKLVFEGLEELKDDLRNMPTYLARDASPIVVGNATAAAADVNGKYQSVKRSGNLASGVSTTVQESTFGTVAIVKSNARHSHLYEYGSQARHTSIGANRGAMPAANVFVPAVIRHRRQMYQQLKALLVNTGAKVTGDA